MGEVMTTTVCKAPYRGKLLQGRASHTCCFSHFTVIYTTTLDLLEHTTMPQCRSIQQIAPNLTFAALTLKPEDTLTFDY